MTPEQRAQMESNAERARRRGEMAEAVRLYRELVQTYPDEAPLKHKLTLLEETLQPMELTSAKAPRFEPQTTSPAPLSPEQEGERLYQLGDFVGAAAAYRRAVALRPESPLLHERLLELVALAQTAPRNSPTDAALPDAAEPLLGALLDRIASRRRLPR